MTPAEALKKLLPSFKRYFDVTTENVTPPFDAEAVFISHTEQYFIVRQAKLSEIDSSERIYFKACSNLTIEQLDNLCQTAWETGLKNVKPYYGHRNSDVTVILILENTDKEVLNHCKKIKLSKSYKFMLFGWSNFKLAAADLTTGKIVTNWFGADYKKLIKKVLMKTGAIHK